MLLDSGLPEYLRTEAASTAVYIFNRISNRQEKIVSFEKLTGKLIDLSYTTKFGAAT